MKRWWVGLLGASLLGMGVPACASLLMAAGNVLAQPSFQELLVADVLALAPATDGGQGGGRAEATETARPLNRVSTSAVPESETWALMIAGVLAVGWMHTRRRR